jgi:hypothetical protein
MHTTTCFDSRESSSGYSMNHKIDVSSESPHFGFPKGLHGKIQVKLHQDNNFVTIIPVSFNVNFWDPKMCTIT